MNRDDLQRLSKDDLIELVLRLQRPDKTSRTSSKLPSTDRKERREPAKPGHEGHSRKLCETPDAVEDRGFWSEVRQVYENRICTSLPSSLRIAWNGVLKPRHFLGVRLAVRTTSWISSSDTLSIST
jgi:hypothetical protein